MQKKLLAAAVVSAFAAPVAFAQPANVTIYGSLTTEMFSLDGTGANGSPNRNRTNVISSPGAFFIGFRGQESLGGGLSAIWQVEQGASADGTGTSSTWGGRNTFVGLAGGFGRTYVGLMDSPLKRVLGINNVMRNGLTAPQGMASILNNGDTSGADPFVSSGSGNTTAFARRNGNSFNYDSPVFSGFQVMAQYQANEGRALTGTGVNPSQYGLAATWRSGPFRAGLGWQQHNDFRGANLTDSSMLASASWTSGPLLVQGAYSTLNYQVTGGDIKRTNYLIGGQYSVGQHRFRAQYQVAGDTKGAVGGLTPTGSTAIGNVAIFNASGSNTGATIWHLNYGYVLSKRTEVYAYYGKLDNDNNARVNFSGSAALGISGNALRGMDATFYGVGIAHSF